MVLQTVSCRAFGAAYPEGRRECLEVQCPKS